MGMMGLFKAKGEAQAVRRSGVYAALDIGAAKSTCFIAKTEPTLAGPRPRVIGVGHGPTKGVRLGSVTDMDEAAASVLAAVKAAEGRAGQAISEITLSVASAGVSSLRIAVDMELGGTEITERDLRRLTAEALARSHQAGRVNLHALPLAWRVDGHRGVKDPRGMFAERLGLDLHIVSAPADPLQNLIASIERCQLTVNAVNVAPYVSGLAALSSDEIELGALVVDMGAHTTSFAVYAEGALQHVDVLPIGGAYVTNDIARGLSTSIGAAERIKVLHGCALDSPDDDRIMIEAPPVAGHGEMGMVQHPRAMLNSIIRPRLEEIFEMIRDRLKAIDGGDASGRQLVLTGGAAQLPGTGELAGRVLGKRARIGRPSALAGLGDAVAGPAFSACAGVIHCAANGPVEVISGPPCFDLRPSARRVESVDRSPAAIWRWFAESF